MFQIQRLGHLLHPGVCAEWPATLDRIRHHFLLRGTDVRRRHFCASQDPMDGMEYNSRMVSKAEILKHREEILALAARNGASNVRIFGSVAREDTGETSDLDLLVRFKPGSSLMDHGMLIEELQELLHVKVDVVSEGALRDHDRFGREVLKEAVPL